MEDRIPRALDAAWQKVAEGKNELERTAFYIGAAAVHGLVQDWFKRAVANRRDGESEREMAYAVIETLARV